MGLDLSLTIAFIINWAVFVPSYRAQTERFFDLTGSLTYISVIATALVASGAIDARSLKLGALVLRRPR